MGYRIFYSAVLAVFLMASPGLALDTDYQVTPNADFQEERIRFSGGVAPPFTILFDIQARNGQLAICGVTHLREGRFGSTMRRMLRGSTIIVGSQEIPVDLRFFARARTAQTLRTTSANCALTGIGLPPRGTGVGLRLAPGTIRL